jgi:hypothetical protein
MAKSIYAGTAPLFLFYSAVVFNDSLIIAFLIGVVIMGISGLPQTKIGSYEYYFILSAVLFLLVIILLWCLNLNEVTAFIELVSLLSLIVTTASIEEAGKLYYLLDYETAIEYLNEGQNQLVTKLLSPRVAIINIIIALVFMYHLNFHLISFSYLVLSVPIITRTIKLLSFNPEQYWNIELEDETIEGVFVYSKPSRGDYITVLSEDGRKRISKGSIVAMHPAETSSE